MVPALNNQTNSLLEILLKNKVISSDIYERVKIEQLNSNKNIEDILLENHYLTPEELVKAKAEYYQLPFVDFKTTSVSPEVLTLLPESICRRYLIFPYYQDKTRGELYVVMANPLDVGLISFIEEKTKLRVKPAFALESEILAVIKQYYTQGLSTQVVKALKEKTIEEESKTRVINANEIGSIIHEAPIAKIVSTLLDFAIKARASDIHIEPEENRTRIRYRIDGILHEKLVLPKNIHDAVVSRIKILSGMKIDEKRVPQDGRFNYRFENNEVDLRVSSMPSVHGEKIVLRLLKKSSHVPSLAELGLRGRALKTLSDVIFAPHGIILITGPTGSGKTTTLYSILSKINTPRVNIMTLEDPVEYEIPGVNQVQINPQAGLTFASGLRSFLRQDPNIIMVGEIRDQETASLAIQAALTGHLVFSTLHTNNSAGALPRLLNMKAEPYLLASSLICVCAQRVVRRICQNCKESYQPSSEIISEIKRVLGSLAPADKEIKLYRGKKCEECNQTGYSERIGIFEVLTINEKISRLILERAPSATIEAQAREDGMVTMIQDGYFKALEGITTIEEILRVSRE